MQEMRENSMGSSASLLTTRSNGSQSHLPYLLFRVKALEKNMSISMHFNFYYVFDSVNSQQGATEVSWKKLKYTF